MLNGTVAGWDKLPLYVGYLAEGLLIGVANLLIILSICRFEALRSSKVHLVMLSLAVADFGNMTGFAMNGAWRIYSVLSGFHDRLVSPWWCASKPQAVVMLLLGIHSAAFQLLLVSVDRLLATAFPLQYLGWSYKRYTYPLMALSHGYTFSTGLFGIALAYTQRYQTTVKAVCSNARAMLAASVHFPVYGLYFSVAPVLFSFASVLVYVLVLYLYKRSTVLNNDVIRERRFTRTLGYSCVCTVFFSVLPLSAGFVSRWLDVSGWGTFFFVLSNLNSLMNLFVYQLHQPEMRMALTALFKWKPMPIDIKQWRANAKAARVEPLPPDNNNAVDLESV